jgi:hypothetical protein
MKRYLPTVAIALLSTLTILSGVIQGRLSNRWGTPPDARKAATVLKELPSEFGGWRLEQTQDLSENVRNTLQCQDYVLGAYVHESGEQVQLAILLGPPGPISVHTPEICYSSREFDQVDERTSMPVGGAEHESHLWRTTFRSRDLDGCMLHVYYAWSDGGRWNASESPRFEYAGRPYLYKLQLAGATSANTATPESDICAKFLDKFIPVWNNAVSSLEAVK